MTAEVETKPKNITAPGKTWRGRAHVSEQVYFYDIDVFGGPGVIYSRKTFPSYDIAETRTIEYCDKCNRQSEEGGDTAVFTPLEPEEAP